MLIVISVSSVVKSEAFHCLQRAVPQGTGFHRKREIPLLKKLEESVLTKVWVQGDLKYRHLIISTRIRIK